MTTPFGLVPSTPVADPGLEHATDHTARAIGALISILRDKPRFTKFVEILIRPFQEIEDVIWDLYTLRRITSAAGVQLDTLGRIVGQDRDGLSDDDYRAVIRIAVRVLFSRGTAPDLLKIAQLFLLSNLFTYDEHFPAAVVLTITDPSAAGRLGLLSRFLKRAKSAGVRIDVVDGTGPRFHYGAEGAGDGYGVAPYGGLI